MGLNSRYEIRVKGVLDGRTSKSAATGRKPSFQARSLIRPLCTGC
jgi:hypothetical protein